MRERAGTIDAPAKTNLVFALGERRADGYHQVATYMQALDLCDTLEASVTPGSGEVRVEAPGLPGGDTIVTDAVRRLVAERAARVDVRLHLRKRIPAGAGLGGGSSDAAAALRLVDALICDDDPADGLRERIACDAGSDVPFFLTASGSALATGRGELVQQLPALEPRLLLVTWGSEPAPTPAVYAAVERRRTRLPTPRELQADVEAGRWWNDLEEAAIRVVPTLRQLLGALRQAGFDALVSGSGSAVVAHVVTAEADRARDVALQAGAQSALVVPTRGWALPQTG